LGPLDLSGLDWFNARVVEIEADEVLAGGDSELGEHVPEANGRFGRNALVFPRIARKPVAGEVLWMWVD
jgi:hypothetical protein